VSTEIGTAHFFQRLLKLLVWADKFCLGHVLGGKTPLGFVVCVK
jgi:hypothetical protein